MPAKTEITRFTVIILLSLGGGVVIGRPLLMLLLGGVLYLGWHFYHLLRLSRLLSEGREIPSPPPGGLWSEVFDHIRQLQIKSRKRKQRLNRYFSRFREAATVLPDAAIIVGQRGGIEWCNPAAEVLLGLHWPQVAGANFSQQMQHPVLEEYLASDDFSRPLEFTSPADKSKVLSLLITPFGKKKQQNLIMVQDITRLYHLDQVRRDFVANVSHELRTPLTVISGFLETMEDADEINSNWGSSIQLMHQQALRMEETINDLLVLSRLEMDDDPPAGEPVQVAQLLAGIVDDAEVLSNEAQHRFSLEADPKLQLRGIEKELRGAFSNLIFNAVHHTPSGSEIRVSWQIEELGARFSVQDTGEGIPVRHIPRLTERFYRVDSARSRESGGTGLGLAIVKHTLNRHDGKLNIVSEEGKGSTFSCWFPQARIVQDDAN
ncbi:Phosphate regulon sensor protein PhoR (SphS) [hydrothermal vent metagenome]|uniref:Phosphate regulon sensor protein PhoR n=1 Tax=hydrothermal vent metagenome TaxID=652676 RepID=A0A3B1B1U9_9ZZZZ